MPSIKLESVENTFMSSLHKLIITLVLLLMAVSIAPSAVTAIEIEQDDWTETFNGSEDNYSNLTGGNGNLNIAAFNVTEDNSKIRFKANISNGTDDGLTDNNGLQIYIDTDPEGDDGLDSETVEDDLANYFDGLGAMNADYRISVTDAGVPVIQEHEEGLQYDTIQRIEMEEKGEQITLEIESETIGFDQLDTEEPVEAKFAYVDDVDAANKEANHVWAPENAVTLPEINVVENAKVNATVEFGDEEVSEDASINFILSDSNGVVAERSIADDQLPTNGTESITFTENNNNFAGAVELEVEVEGDDTYSTAREEINNTVNISEDGLDPQKYNGKIALSIIDAEVSFGNGENVDDETAVDYTLIDNGGNEVGNAVDNNLEEGDTQTNETFTVNPNNFNEDGEIGVEVDDTDYPLDEAQGVDDISVGGSVTKTFDAAKIGHEFILSIDQNEADVTSDNGFTLNVSLESNESAGGQNISTVDHEIDFNGEDLNIENKSQNISYVNVSESDIVGPDEPDINNETGTVEIFLANDSDIVTEGNNETLYQIEFEFEEGLQEDMDEGDAGERTYSPNIVSETTNIANLSTGSKLSFTSEEDEIDVRNSETDITDATVTHLTEGSDMVNTTTRFAVEVDTNEGELKKIMLNKTKPDGTVGKLPNRPDDNLVIDCNNESSCGVGEELQYTPTKDNETWSGIDNGYNTFEFNITVVDGDDDKFYIPSDTENIDQSDLQTEIHRFGDVTENGEAESSDLIEVLQQVPEESGGLPWDDGELAAADINNDGEITMSDASLIYQELN